MKTFKEFDIRNHINYLMEACIAPPSAQYGLNLLKDSLPQCSGDGILDLLAFCRDCGTRVTKRKIKAISLKPSQSEIDFDKVISIIQNLDFDNIDPIIIDIDNYIIDGHHRWSAIMYKNPAFEVPVYQLRIKLKTLIARNIKDIINPVDSIDNLHGIVAAK